MFVKRDHYCTSGHYDSKYLLNSCVFFCPLSLISLYKMLLNRIIQFIKNSGNVITKDVLIFKRILSTSTISCIWRPVSQENMGVDTGT